MIGEKGKTKLSETELKMAIDKLISILDIDLDNKVFSHESEITASDLRGAIALALSNYEDKASCAIEYLLELSKDQEPETRKNVAIALGKIGVKSKEVMQILEMLKNDDFIEVKDAAENAVQVIIS